jgi:hypothetical protein
MVPAHRMSEENILKLENEVKCIEFIQATMKRILKKAVNLPLV